MKNRSIRHRFALASVVALVLGAMAGSTPVSAQSAGSASGAAYGLQLEGPVPIAATPAVEAQVPPGPKASETDSLVEVPADPLATSYTALVEADASVAPTVEPKLQATIEEAFAGAPATWHSRGFAITEDLVAISGQLTADVIEAESTAGCDGTTPVFGTAARIVNLSLGGQDIPVLNPSPNQVLIDQAGIRIVFWETNWDPETGGTTDGADSVFANALHVTAPGGVDLVVSHSEAAVANCIPADEPVGPDIGPNTEKAPNTEEAPPADPVPGAATFTG